MKLYFAINGSTYMDNDRYEVYGPFSKRRAAADFIEKDESVNEYGPWWGDDWYIGEYEVTDKWDKASHLCSSNSKIYRPAYCKEQRRIAHEKWREDNPKKANVKIILWQQ